MAKGRLPPLHTAFWKAEKRGDGKAENKNNHTHTYDTDRIQ
jgi:hypothetical protein